MTGSPSYLRLLNSTDGTFADATMIEGVYTDGVFTVTNQSFVLGNGYTLGELRHGRTMWTPRA
jgi:hypothetical protein